MNKLVKFSFFISLIGISLLYYIFLNSPVKFIESKSIDETFIGKTIRSEVHFSSLKQFNGSTIIYPKSVNLRIIAFGNKKLDIPNDSIIEFNGIVKEDKYGLIIISDQIIIRQK